MLSAPVCRQAGWLNAECKLKNAKSPSVKLERQHVCTFARQNDETCLVLSPQSLVLSLQSILVFFLIEASQSCKLERQHVYTFARQNWELGTGNWEFLFSIFCFPFPFPSFPSLCALTRLHIDTFTCQKWELGISVFRFLFS